MALTATNRVFKNNGKDIKYLNKDFVNFRNNLLEYAKTYFPKTYSDFNEASPGMMFIEMASFVGDSLSYYIDDTLKESLMVYAEDPQNVLALSQYLGYKPKVTAPAITTLSVYQLVPSIGTGSDNIPDSKYYLRIKSGMTSLSTTDDIEFRSIDIVDFNDSVDREITVFQRSATGEPTFYLIKKLVKSMSAIKKTRDVTFGTYQPYQTINLDDPDVIQIFSVVDSAGSKYYEVPYLAQELVYSDVPNIESNDPDLYQFKTTVPYILNTLKTTRRFTTRINQDSTTTIQFGVGDSSVNDETIIPTLKNVGLGLPNSISRLGQSFDPTNFLKTNTYGTSPANTTITVTYFTGGGVKSNVAIGQLKSINGIEFDEDLSIFTPTELATYNSIRSSVAIDNEVPATGGRSGETIDEIRENALANFGAQNRVVTPPDFQVLAISMPTKYGSVAKAYASADSVLDSNDPASILSNTQYLDQFTKIVMDYVSTAKTTEEVITETQVKSDMTNFVLGKVTVENEKNNPLAVNLYVLGYDSNNKLTPLNRAVKENLKTYFNEYRMLTDGINIIDGFIINIGINYEITVRSNYNKSDVLVKCNTELKNYFNIDRWTFNQTINLSEVELLLANVDGVNTVSSLEVVNKHAHDGDYAANSYDISAATKNKTIYPSLDPSCFEIRYPDTDIKGRVK